jgi:energy-coupling factor transport system ATP-binding protein
MSEVAVAVRDVRYVYPAGGIVALDGLSLEFAPGTTSAIVGQNGSGKTTLTKLLNGLLQPTAGAVFIDGRATTGRPVQDLAHDVGYVFQNPNHQLFARSVAEELAFGPRNLGLDPDDVASRVAIAAEAFGLTAVLDAHPYHLGFPLRKLVSIASVVAMRSSILVLDEPTTGQDRRTIDAIARAIQSLATSGVTLVCVTHDMAFVAAVADRVVVLRDGRLVTDGTPRQVFADERTISTARLLPPQIARLSMAMPGRGQLPPALSVAELIAEVRDSSRRPVGPPG